MGLILHILIYIQTELRFHRLFLGLMINEKVFKIFNSQWHLDKVFLLTLSSSLSLQMAWFLQAQWWSNLSSIYIHMSVNWKDNNHQRRVPWQ